VSHGSEFQGSTVLQTEQEAIHMAHDNPSGIIFDDPGPGAGLKAPGVPKPADKIAAVAAKAKVVPGVRGAATAAAPALKAKKGSKVWAMTTVERYKAQTQLNELEAAGAVIFAILPSVSTQNSYDVFSFTVAK
jgi:hypothetical protein